MVSTFKVSNQTQNKYSQHKIELASRLYLSLYAYQYYLQPSLLSDEIFEGRGIDQTSLS